jgi:FAD/FMN-containing dehydrogenase
MSSDDDKVVNENSGLSRRDFLSGVAGTAALTLVPAGRLYAGPHSLIPKPPHFPSSISLYQQTFTDWAQEIKVSNVWTCSPATSADVVTLANWAHANGWRLRPMGTGHGFAPFILPRGSNGAKFLLVNTHDHLTGITVNASQSTVTCQAGAHIQDICTTCEPYNMGFLHTTAPGDITIAGGLAMDVHGASLPAQGQTLARGHSYGTFSNLVLSLTAVVWDTASNAYVLKTFQRTDPAIGPLLTSLSRAFITDVTLQMGPTVMVRCLSRVDVSPPTLFAPPSSADSNSYAALSNQGTLDVLWEPFVRDSLWIKIYSQAPVKPASSRAVTAPYNYPGTEMALSKSNTIAFGLRTLQSSVKTYNTQSAKTITTLMTPTAGDTDTQVYDLWGPAYCTSLYVLPDTLRLTVGAWGVLLSRSNLQRALSEFYTYFTTTLDALAAKGKYPYTGPVEIRAIGLDHTSDVVVPNAVEPYLSAARPVPDHPEYDTLLWFAINSNVDQPGAASFYYNLEQWLLSNYSSYAIVRPEWTKTYAYTSNGSYGGGWTNTTLLTQTFPGTFRNHGYPSSSTWDAAVSTLESYDPYRVFTGPFLDTLMPA